MRAEQQERVVCQICKEQKKISEVLPAELVRSHIVELIRKKHPEWSSSGFICLPDLNHFRTEYVEDVLEEEKWELSALEEGVVTSLKEHELLSKNINIEFDRELTFGKRQQTRLPNSGIAGAS
jgi:hypothetical protein